MRESRLLLPPSAEVACLVKKEINNNHPNKQKESVLQLKEWMETQPHLPRNYDERILSRFLVGTKFHVHRAQRKIDNYFTSRTKMPEFFTKRDPYSKEIQQAVRALSVLPLARTRSDGARVSLHILNDVDSSEHVAEAVYKMIFMIADIRMAEEPEISGDVFIFDLKNASLTVVLKHAGSALKKALTLAQSAYPQRLKEIHIINAHSFVNKSISIFRSFMKEKMRNRFMVHSNVETLHQHVSPDILPAEYGGTHRSVQQLREQWSKALESHALYFQQQEGVKASIHNHHHHHHHHHHHSKKTSTTACTETSTFRNLSLD